MSQLTQAKCQTRQQATNSSLIKSNQLQRAAITPIHSPTLQQCSNGVECLECLQKRLERGGTLQRAAVDAAPTNGVPPIVHDVLSSPGQSLDAATRAFMEPRFGHDFSQVPVRTNAIATSSPSPSFHMPSTVLAGLPASLQPAAHKVELHNDQFAHRVARGLDLEAFVMGEHIYFGEGHWQPSTERGRALLQHELGHVSRREGRNRTVEGWSSQGHRTITREALTNDPRYSAMAKTLLVNTAPVPDYNRPQILQDMISFWAGGTLVRIPILRVSSGIPANILGAIGGGIVGSFTPPEQGTQVGKVRIGGAIPQAILGTGRIPTVPAEERIRGGEVRPELQGTRVTQELANHGEDLPPRNEARMNEYVDQGIRIANGCDLQNGLVQLGYALHVAQDRGSHGDGYTLPYVHNRPHRDIDNMSLNPEGLRVALSHSREVINRFFDGLTQQKRSALANPLSLQATQPPLAQTLLPVPRTNQNIRSTVPGEPVQSGGINLLSLQF